MADELNKTTTPDALDTATDATLTVEPDAIEVESTEVEPVAEAVPDQVVDTEAVANLDEEVATQPSPSSTIVPDFRAGDTLRLGIRIVEGEKTRIQYFEGMVLSRKGAGVSKSFTIRKIGAGGIAVERIFPVICPSIASFDVRRRGVVRRAKVYFLRDIVGSTANVIKERKVAKEIQQVKEARAAKKAVKTEKRNAKQVAPKVKAVKEGTRSAQRSAKKSS